MDIDKLLDENLLLKNQISVLADELKTAKSKAASNTLIKENEDLKKGFEKVNGAMLRLEKENARLIQDNKLLSKLEKENSKMAIQLNKIKGALND